MEAIKAKRVPKPKDRRIKLSDGTKSSVLSPFLHTVLRGFDLSVLSYGALVELNKAINSVRSNTEQASGGAYTHTEHFKYSYLLSKHCRRRVYDELLPWLLVNAHEVRHYSSFARALEYCIFLNLSNHPLTTDEVRALTGTNAVYITMSQMMKAGVIGESGKVGTEVVKGKLRKAMTFVLTKKGKTLVRLACESFERQENALRSMLFKP
jgi:hypothetical protein